MRAASSKSQDTVQAESNVKRNDSRGAPIQPHTQKPVNTQLKILKKHQATTYQDRPSGSVLSGGQKCCTVTDWQHMVQCSGRKKMDKRLPRDNE